MRPIIQSKKHIFQIGQSQVAQGLITNQEFANAIEGQPSQPVHVQEGATVKACYIELWLGTESATTIGSFTVIVQKNPGNAHAITTTNMAALHDYANKKNILFTTQGLLPLEAGGLVPVMRGWYKIPKGKQRMGLNDALEIVIRNNNTAAIDIEFCGFVLYKEYT